MWENDVTWRTNIGVTNPQLAGTGFGDNDDNEVRCS